MADSRVQTSSVNLLKDNSNEWNFDEILRYKEAKCFAYDGTLCCTESLKMLNALVKHAIEQTSVWWSPGGRYKKFISNNSDLILSWNYDKGLLSFHEKTGDRLKELFIDICTSKKSALINTFSLRSGLDAASATVSNTNNFSLCVEQDNQNDSPCSKGLSLQPSFNPSTLE